MAHTTSSQQDGRTVDSGPPLQGLVLAPHAPLESAQLAGRMKCPSCSGSRMFYCYTCCCLVGVNPEHVPTVKLPVKIDIIKHPNETDGKSTAVHAKLVAPDDVCIYTYPCIPELDGQTQNANPMPGAIFGITSIEVPGELRQCQKVTEKNCWQLVPKVVLVFPGPDAMTVEELQTYFCKTEGKRGAGSPAEERRVKKLKVEEERESSHTCTPEHADESHKHTCPVQRVIFIDSTWNQTTRIITDERLQALPQVELKSRKTCFWRHQRGSPDTYLATIEAIYYFLKDFHVHCLLREYRGEYDNLLFFYSFLHKLISKAKRDAGKS